MKQVLFLFILSIALVGCKKNAVPTKVDDAGLSFYGETITADNVMSIDELLVKMKTQDSIETKVKGQIESVCKVKGCWMNIVSPSDPEGGSMFVKFKDYGFFMPLDSDGQMAIMRGKAYREVTSVDELRHYAEDEGKSKEEIAKITEPVEELKFMADGVILEPKKG